MASKINFAKLSKHVKLKNESSQWSTPTIIVNGTVHFKFSKNDNDSLKNKEVCSVLLEKCTIICRFESCYKFYDLRLCFVPSYPVLSSLFCMYPQNQIQYIWCYKVESPKLNRIRQLIQNLLTVRLQSSSSTRPKKWL